MASNRVMLGASLFYSLTLVLASGSDEPSSIFNLIRIISHLVDETPKDYSFSVIYPNVMKGAFVYSIAMVFLSTAMTFASFSSLRELITAITRHWKPFLASIVVAVIFPAMLRPPSMVAPFGTYFNVTLFHALFVVYSSVKLVTIPMLKEKIGNDVLEVPKNFSRKFIVTQILMSIMQIVTLHLSSKEKGEYKMQVVLLVLGIVCEVMHMIWLATFYELMVFSLLVYVNNKKNKKLAEEAKNSSSESLALLVDERLP